MNDFTDTNPDLAALVDRWQDDIAPLLLPNHCILAARVLSRLQPDRVTVHEVGVMAANQIAQTTLPTLAPHQPLSSIDGAWTVAAGPVGLHPDPTMVDNTTGGFDGHVVAVADRRWLIDLSATQMDRPHRGIRIRRPIVIDLAAPATPSFLPVPVARMWNLRDLGAGIGWIHYRILPPARHPRWEHAPDWCLSDRADYVLARINNETGAT
jgi:hypothetical protein